MPGTTPELAFPYPLPSDPADVPADIQKLAEAIESVFVARAGEYRQAASSLSSLTCAGAAGGGAWTATPTGSDAGFPLQVDVACPVSKMVSVQVGAMMSTPDASAYADMGFRIYKGGTQLVAEANNRLARLNGTGGSLQVTTSRLSVVTVSAATPGDILTVRATFRNAGTTGTVTFSYPNIVVHTRTSQDV